MANLNKVMLIGRLTRDPETRAFSNGGKVAKFGFAVNNRKKNSQSGQWEDEPVFLDCEAFNRGDQGTLATRIEETLRKGQQIFIEGHLKLDQWEKDGQKRQQIKVVIDNFQYLEPKGEGGGGYSSRPAARPAEEPNYTPPDEGTPSWQQGGGPAEEDIPFALPPVLPWLIGAVTAGLSLMV